MPFAIDGMRDHILEIWPNEEEEEEEMTDNKSSNRNSAAIARLEFQRGRRRKLKTTDHCNECSQNRVVRFRRLDSILCGGGGGGAG